MVCAPQFQKLYQIETKRLVFAVGILFIAVLLLQSSSLPYGGVLLSLLSMNSISDSNSTDSSVFLGVVKNTEGIIDVRNLDNDYQLQEDQISESESYSEVLHKNSLRENDHNSVLRKPEEPDKVISVEEDGRQDNEENSLTRVESGFVSQPFASWPVDASHVPNNLTLLSQSSANSSKIDVSAKPKTSSMGKEATKALSKAGNDAPLQTNLVSLTENSTITSDTITKRERIPPASISKMTSLLLESRVSSRAMRPRWSSIRDQELLFVKSQIESAREVKTDPELYAPLYRNISMFKRSYELMENMFKVYIYNEGEKPIFHQPKLKGIYASEGWFMELIEGNKQFVVKNPAKAHMFYLPFSALMLRLTLKSLDHKSHAELLKHYVELIAGKYRFWNRTGGADHFLVACHDWAPAETIKYMGTCIRALCNANVARSFKIGKDVSLPVTVVRFADDPLRSLGGKPPSKRPFLAFFAGSMHGYVRPILLQYWENKDPDMKLSGPLPRNGKLNYIQYMKSTKYCICARGYEVHTPRVVEAIFHECVPVIISDNYVPPFFEVLNWEAFSVFIQQKDIPNLKSILLSIPNKKYLEMQKRVKKVQKHFLWHKNPVKHDIFHMTLHSIWYNRVFQIKPR